MSRRKLFSDNEAYNYEERNWRHGNGANLVQVDATYLRHLEWLAEEVFDQIQEAPFTDEGMEAYGLGGILGECFYEMRPRHDGRFSNYPMGDKGRIWKHGRWEKENSERGEAGKVLTNE